ncbi:hypothetical protein ACF0CD_16950, partial [Acinetobacter baumannii]
IVNSYDKLPDFIPLISSYYFNIIMLLMGVFFFFYMLFEVYLKTHCISREKLHNLTPNSKKLNTLSQLCALKHIINK